MKQWYVLRSKPNKENLVCGQLFSRQIEYYFPYTRVKPINPRSQTIRAYFPGYLFIHVDCESVGVSTLAWMPGAIGLVVFGSEPACIPDALLQSLRCKVESINRASTDFFNTFKAGDVIVISEGPFAGYEAVFDTHLPGSERVRVFLKLLQGQQIRMELPAGQVDRL